MMLLIGACWFPVLKLRVMLVLDYCRVVICS